MGSATREALSAATATLSEQRTVDLATGEQLLAAALVVDGSAPLRSALSDDTAPVESRRSIVKSVFGSYTPAAQAVLEAAGGAVLTLDGQPLRYNHKESLLNPDFIALGDAGLPWRDWLRD